MNRLSTVAPATTAHSVPRRSSRTDVAKTANLSIGAARGASPVGKRAEPQTGGAAAPSAPNPYTYEHVCLDDYVSRACPCCEGVGEVELLALDATRPAIVDCDTCGGTGEVAVYCQCGEPVTGGAPDGDNGVCHACELVFHRDLEPTDDQIYAGWETAERYALQFRDGEAAR